MNFMKKLLLFAAVNVASIGAFSQYILTSASAPKAGDAYYQIYDTIPTVSKGEAGQGKTWDLTLMDFDVDAQSSYSDASSSQYASSFPDAELVVDGQDVFFDLTADRTEWIGLVIDFGTGPTPVRLSNPESLQRYPSAYGSSYQDTSAFTGSFYIGMDFQGTTIDSGRVKYNSTKSVSYDGEGTLITQAGVFPNSLRERAYVITKQTFEACVVILPGFPCQWVDAGTLDPSFSGEPDTNVIYTWYNAKSTSPMADITYNAAEDSLISASCNMDPSFVGIKTVSAKNASVFPNPASSLVYLKDIANVQTVVVTDLQGRTVKTVNQTSNTLDVSDLMVGNYILTIVSADATTTTPLQILR